MGMLGEQFSCRFPAAWRALERDTHGGMRGTTKETVPAERHYP
jgi:hypothetical protein